MNNAEQNPAGEPGHRGPGQGPESPAGWHRRAGDFSGAFADLGTFLPLMIGAFAVLRLDQGKLVLEASFRFFNYDQSLPLQQGVESLAVAYGLHVEPQAGYPGWQPDFDSALLERGCALHEKLFGFRPAVKAIHAGLECGILKSKKPDVDILSFGPTIRGAHSPTERLEIATVAPFWQYLTALLADM